MKESESIRVFYSWQSDSPKETNLNAIRSALEKAAKVVRKKIPRVNIVPDEATRDTSGSPNIALKILEKIEQADVFVADITTITPAGAQRPCPNPNVTYELGYAVAQLGWDRVILLFNAALGDFPKDLPFDFIQQRASRYSIDEATPKVGRPELQELLSVAISAVIDKNPKRPAELRGLSRERLEHDHDVENMTWLMSKLHLPTLDQQILEMPHRITDRALWFWDGFNGVVSNSLFNLYDPVLKSAVERLHQAWGSANSYGEFYHDTPSGRAYVFTNPGDMPLTGERQEAWDRIATNRNEMKSALDDLLARLRQSYIEVVPLRCNEKSWQSYMDFQREHEEFERKRSASSKKRKKTAKAIHAN